MGGAAGLFVGASLLSFVEIAYYFLFRSRDKPKLKERDDDIARADGSTTNKKITHPISTMTIPLKSSDMYSSKAVQSYNYNVKKSERKAQILPVNTKYTEVYLP